MNIFVVDQNAVQETEGVIVSFVQSGPLAAQVFLQNNGVNTVNYRFENFDGTTWNAMGSPGTDLQNTLTAGQVRSIAVNSAVPQVRLIASASGGSVLQFSVTRTAPRASGGPLPILNL